MWQRLSTFFIGFSMMLAFSEGGFAQSGPSLSETIEYINNVMTEYEADRTLYLSDPANSETTKICIQHNDKEHRIECVSAKDLDLSSIKEYSTESSILSAFLAGSRVSSGVSIHCNKGDCVSEQRTNVDGGKETEYSRYFDVSCGGACDLRSFHKAVQHLLVLEGAMPRKPYNNPFK